MEKRIIIYLCLVYIIHLFALGNASLAALYGILLLPIMVGKDVVINKGLAMRFLLLFLINVLLIPIIGVNWREMALLMWFLLLLLFFDTNKIQVESFVKFINYSYLFYLFLSVLVTLHIVVPDFSDELNQFDVDVGNSTMATLVGYNGTTAGIDSYSAIIFLVNLLFSKGMTRVCFVPVSLIAILLTFRFTPLVSLAFALVVLIIKNTKLLTLYKMGIAAFCLFSFFIPLLYVNDFDFLDEITHSRAKIWIEYWIIWGQSGLGEMLFGIRQQHLPEIVFTQWQGWFSNPHSSYMRIFLFWGVLIYILFSYYLITNLLKRHGNKVLSVLSLIMVCGITNFNILWNENPIYILSFVFFSSLYKWDDFNCLECELNADDENVN